MNRRKVLIKQVKDWRRITSALDAKVEVRKQVFRGISIGMMTILSM